MSLNEDIIDYIRQQENSQVGEGECWDLAEEALKDAGARTSNDYGTVTATSDYKWGEPVTMSQVMAGDVIQFKNFKYKIVITKADGSSTFNTFDYPHHTAIVYTVLDRGQGIMEVFEQNVENVKYVKKGKYYFKSVKFETTENSKKVKYEITVSGHAKFYRPQVKAKARK